MTKESDLFYLYFLKPWGAGAPQTTGGTAEFTSTCLLSHVIASFPLFFKTWKQTSSSNTNQIKMPP